MLHIIQNDPEVPPGNICDTLTVPYVVHHPYRDGYLPEPEHIAALIVMGGAMGAHDDTRHPFLRDLKCLIRAVVADRIPYLGICLGGQLLAAALGAQVVSNRWEELGISEVALSYAGTSDALFAGIAEKFTTFQWHHDSFDIPAGGVVLATSAACRHQAFRVGDCAWGLQFHPEVTEQIIRDWSAWDEATRIKTEELVAAFSCAETGYRNTSRQLVNNFLRSAGIKNRMN
ncbi:MAG: type 1 glutamine amidotransferase [Geobacteraceae bacterium]|nr:type 1 glutamine amidotransferase [Geobacteraceae bacterium]